MSPAAPDVLAHTRRRLIAAGAGLAFAVAAGPAAAEGPSRTAPPTAPSAAERALEKAAETSAQKASREEELKALQEELRANAEAKARLDAEIAALRSDRAKLNAALLDATERTKAAETRITALEQRLMTLDGSEQAIRRSLESRRGVIVEVLAALQRMGRRPPPAVLARPEDMLEAVRTSILLGAVVPELRAETEALASDLAELLRLRAAIASDKQALDKDLATLAGERERLSALVAARQQQLVDVERLAADEAGKATALAAQARSLKELIDRMEREISASQRAAEEARKAAEAQAREAQEKLAAAPFKDPARLAPKIAFAEAKGMLPMPVSGQLLRPFGAPDGFGGATKGISLAARPGGIVAAPSDGWVAFAGPFRSFGQLLIINAGGGYYILLAGMERINVALGQFVLAGEPVAVMGETATPLSTAFGGGTNGPVLYVEFRKDGGSIDPAPWWARSQGEKVRG
ncbi:peptidoglycan DD-metalloendopeptidase family protein [Chelatococcus sp. SYSU_G07232]|uniref:Peptidoglycan DD-metalloendopeptidase family protein n=1 Tax=Chelatococcus albus TaxID=3047466 RepID=A0ABT7ADW1_9HYPH|nr:peptidoglycan DD-metalloendopeptidase family protein [Chelatococcus sp. SYSU_G07232]MDJ1157549.1 peptidoglycan DD-metalloendopeptidase family protein [Chelatococcus sp. SYSU_G07232]